MPADLLRSSNCLRIKASMSSSLWSHKFQRSTSLHSRGILTFFFFAGSSSASISRSCSSCISDSTSESETVSSFRLDMATVGISKPTSVLFCVLEPGPDATRKDTPGPLQAYVSEIRLGHSVSLAPLSVTISQPSQFSTEARHREAPDILNVSTL